MLQCNREMHAIRQSYDNMLKKLLLLSTYSDHVRFDFYSSKQILGFEHKKYHNYVGQTQINYYYTNWYIKFHK